MQLIVNGERKDIRAARLDALLAELEYDSAHLAIALNYDVIPRAKWSETALKDGDEVEILTPRQGG